jgi:hypothetical protein
MMPQFSEKEYELLIHSVHSKGVAEGAFKAREEMGRILDQISEFVTPEVPYRFPVWVDTEIRLSDTKHIQHIQPKTVELSKAQIMAIRCLLCGPPEKK